MSKQYNYRITDNKSDASLRISTGTNVDVSEEESWYWNHNAEREDGKWEAIESQCKGLYDIPDIYI